MPELKNTKQPADPYKEKRYIYTLLMIFVMVAIAEGTGEKEIIFPEMAALSTGMWIVDKRVWQISKLQFVPLMTLGAIFGICLVRYSPFPMPVNLPLAFTFAAFCLIFSRTTLIPLISACMLPVLLQTESWIYPLAVCLLSVIIVGGQFFMEKKGLRQKLVYAPVARRGKQEIKLWGKIGGSLFLFLALPLYSSTLYVIAPPLIVTYVEFANSKAGFRNRPVQIFLTLGAAALWGTALQGLLHYYWGIPECLVALLIFAGLFSLFIYTNKLFAPACAIALLPLIIPKSDLWIFPLQVCIGSVFFITTAMLLFLKCYKWPKSHLIVCLVPDFLRNTSGRHQKQNK
ncbi:HPP family protein [uncultured Odoribacter sp.]|uniref:HPP family protein n=1 Tax=uncultured Odoribacter sp. TaxID=876416 RepID=UPI002636F2D8|nr:HPP family protein [uncultured Odoribacter sp.]